MSDRAPPKSTPPKSTPPKSISPKTRAAKYAIGQVVRHKHYPFRGVIFDVDPEFNNTEEWWLSIPEEIRPRKDQPFYHLFAENAETQYIAYVSEQNLRPTPRASRSSIRRSTRSSSAPATAPIGRGRALPTEPSDIVANALS
jgi:heat shock protein HspQ